MAKKKLQDDVLFGEQDIITPEPSASASTDSHTTESSVDDAALRPHAAEDGCQRETD